MSDHTIPQGTDLLVLSRLCRAVIGRDFTYDAQSFTPPTSVTFLPDLTTDEATAFTGLLDVASSNINFRNLPNWATWTAQEASDAVQNGIWNGLDQTAVNNYIDTTLSGTTLATLKPQIITVLKQTATAVLSIRTILVALAKAIVYLRNLALK